MTFVKRSATCECVGNRVNSTLSDTANPSRSIDTQSLELPSQLAPRTILTADTTLSLSVNTNPRHVLLSVSKISKWFSWHLHLSQKVPQRLKCLQPFRHCRSVSCQCGPDDLLDCGTLPAGDHEQIKTTNLDKLWLMSETDDKTTLMFLSCSVRESILCICEHGAISQLRNTSAKTMLKSAFLRAMSANLFSV